MSVGPNLLMGLGGLLDFLQTQQHNQRMAGYRDEALNYLDSVDTQDFGAPNLDELMTSGLFDDQSSLLFNPDQLTRDTMATRRQYGGAMDDAYDTYTSALDEGLGGARADLNSGLFGLRETTQRGINEQNRHRIVEGSGFDMLGLDNPEERYQQALTYGNEAASANQDAALRSEIDNSFSEQARLGVDPFEAGAFGDTRTRLNNNRYGDLFRSQQAATGERNRVQEFNVGARAGELESERSTNRNIDSAIAALSRGEQEGATSLYGTHMTTDAGLREGMLGNLFQRQTGVEGNYLPQITGLQEELARLTQQGREAEVGRQRGNIETAQGIRMGEVGANQSMIAQRLATLLHDPEILAMIQPLIANTFDRFQG